MKRTAYLQSAAILSFVSILPACSRTSSDVGTIVHDSGTTGGISSGGGSGGVSGAGGTGQASTGGAGGMSDATVAPDANVCDQLSVTASTQFQSYLDSRPMTCQSDSDCTITGFATLDCFLTCGGYLMGTADLAAVTATAATSCDQYFAAGCPKMLPLFCPASETPHSTCDSGRCAYAAGSGGSGGSGGVSGGAGTGGAGGGSDATVSPDAYVCDQLSVAASTQFQSYLDSRPKICQSDSDCTVTNFSTLDCFLSCGFLMETADVATVEAAAATVCDQYFAAGCPKPLPLLCPAGAVPDRTCVLGRCGNSIPDAGADSAPDSSVSSKCSVCGADELCVGFYDGTCTAMGTNCVKVSAATRDSILVTHESCFAKPASDEICGTRDGGAFWGCGQPACSNETLVSDVNCYGP